MKTAEPQAPCQTQMSATYITGTQRPVSLGFQRLLPWLPTQLEALGKRPMPDEGRNPEKPWPWGLRDQADASSVSEMSPSLQVQTRKAPTSVKRTPHAHVSPTCKPDMKNPVPPLSSPGRTFALFCGIFPIFPLDLRPYLNRPNSGSTV